MRFFLFFILFFIANEFHAQQAMDSIGKVLAQNISSDSINEIPQGVIYVRKSNIIPYIKVEYKYYLSHVTTVKVNRPVENGVEGNVETDNVPVFDSAIYSKKLARAFPKENILLSKMFVENMNFRYNPVDTPRVDTMVIGFWINSRGKIQRVLDDPEYTLKMPEQMVNELTKTSQTVSEWGGAGGYYPKKKRFRKTPLILESYYCEVFVIVSSYPLTKEQRITSYSAFDYPLNSPPINEQQKNSAEINGEPVIIEN
ncbi:hypothetical protein BH09BAC5_BH09BAC5_07980 [soil metagenome]